MDEDTEMKMVLNVSTNLRRMLRVQFLVEKKKPWRLDDHLSQHEASLNTWNQRTKANEQVHWERVAQKAIDKSEDKLCSDN